MKKRNKKISNMKDLTGTANVSMFGQGNLINDKVMSGGAYSLAGTGSLVGSALNLVGKVKKSQKNIRKKNIYKKG